ncbi:MAG: zinc-binding dehydrogenase, partial [Actinobacteria bacterium]|nr:zinc-binding dehydrogenase [Actinomycetota bacterium]
LSVVGSTMGTKQELRELLSLLTTSGLRPHVDRVLPLREVADGLRAMERGQLLGKIVIEP